MEVTYLVTVPRAYQVFPMNDEETYFLLRADSGREFMYEVETDTLYELFGDMSIDHFCYEFGLE